MNRSMITASAAMEQMSSGQIGQPAACIIENNMALSCGRSGAALAHSLRADYGVTLASLSRRCRDFVPMPSIGLRRPRFIHRSRGQLCGQPGGAAPALQRRCHVDQIAEELSMKIPFRIKHLLHRPAVRRGVLPVSASAGAAVELSGRASHGFADA
jgi:hypothetical protein